LVTVLLIVTIFSPSINLDGAIASRRAIVKSCENTGSMLGPWSGMALRHLPVCGRWAAGLPVGQLVCAAQPRRLATTDRHALHRPTVCRICADMTCNTANTASFVKIQ
jgi:hypothetical protein